ncbi:ankyrin repeat and fibronectin type-III domain-containing protein 1 isoform X1 [Triplophysa dalaica]|uniref:ankyrin repeat and fibronectin type-III domain-containing protein 1 isoform X1 n=3 Tax=Triplophysa dalaica TaxID=1582913 RepID=UPI0024DF89D3|nr:ankyrin repeat and fibronectin type-III domain-containing protein 1 isoform X1 [Triplophysa dalaica]
MHTRAESKMASFGKLTDYFNRRRSRDELMARRDARRSGSYCCTVAEARSLERRLQRPVLAKSRTLPSIPQSPAAIRGHHSANVCVQQQRARLPSSPGPVEACTLPSAGELWRLEDETEGGVTTGAIDLRPRSQSPFSHFRRRAAYLRKSMSADDNLDDSVFEPTQTEGRSLTDPKVKLKRKFSLGSIDRKRSRQRSESGIVKLTQRLSLKDKHCKDINLQSRTPAYRRRSLSVDWAESKMTQQFPDPLPLITRKYSSGSCSSPPSAARRLYRNLSGKFRMANLPTEDPVLPALDKEHPHKTTMFQGNEALFEAVEHQELGVVESLLNTFSLEELDLNTPNSEGLLPLDIAIMTNNVPMAKLLLRAGAKESPHFLSLEGRASHLASLVQEAEHRKAELAAQVTGEEPEEREESNRERQLKTWEWKLRLYKRMQTGYTHASPPEPPSAVHLSVSSSTSLRVHFQEPLCHNSAVITKYRVGWCSVPSFSPLLGEMVIEDVTQLQYDITGLATGTCYYVQVSAYNMKGWSLPQISEPACATPSSWREVDGLLHRQQGLKETLEQLLGQIKGAHRHSACHEPSKTVSNIRKHSVSKSLRHLFQPTSKFVKNLKRGLYLACIFYKDDNVLVTPEDQLPVVEVEDSYSCHAQDFLWFTKVSHLWEELTWIQQCISPAHASSSCTLQTRLKMLQAAAQLQALLGTVDLGQVYFEPIKDNHGNAVLVLMRDVGACLPLEGVRWIPVSKFQLQRRSSSSDEATALETLLTTLHEKLSYHRRSRKCLSPGLYLGYLKLYTSVDQIRVLVSHKHPNVLCHGKIRDNGHVSREEWEWLQSLNSLEGSVQVCDDVQSAPHRLLLELRTAAKDLLSSINIHNNQAQDFRVYVKEVVELGEGVSFLLLLPPCEEVCSPPGQNHLCSLRSSFFTLPLQIFELVHFEVYSPSFIALYCRVSALLGLESLMSQQSLREAFSETELLAAKQKHQQVEDYVQHLEDLWRDARWMAVLQSARYKHQNSGASLGWIIDFSKESIPEKTPSTSSQPSYLPSPAPSPDTTRKHNDSQGLSDEDTSEVFLAADSNFNSSVPTSTRELDLLPPSPTSFRSVSSAHPPSSPRSSLSQPDVLRTGVSKREHLPMNSFDSDFILPSRQIELLRVTEKRTALCVRTSSLEYPPSVSTATSPPSSTSQKRWTRPSSFDLCFSHEPCPVPVRTLSEDSGVQRLSAHSAGSPLRLCHTTLRVYPQYRTGLPKDTSVKLRVTTETSAKEMVRLVVQEINTVCRHLQNATHQCTCVGEPCGFPACVSEVCVYGAEQLEHFGLVLLVEGRDKWLQDDFCPLSLQNPWTRGKLCVRFKEYSPLALQFSRATPV